MKIVLTCDYRAIEAKHTVAEYLRQQGHDVTCVGAEVEERDSYIQRADEGVAAMRAQQAERGVFICGSGTGFCIRANRYPHIRAVAGATPELTHYGRHVNDMNVLCLAGNPLQANWEEVVTTFLDTPFSGGRRTARVEELAAPLV